MANVNIRVCKCCGKTYKFCNHCENAAKTPWKNICDTETCRDILNIVSAYNMGKASKSDIKRVLEQNHIIDASEFLPQVANVINLALTKSERKAEVDSTSSTNTVQKRRKKKKAVDVELNKNE